MTTKKPVAHSSHALQIIGSTSLITVAGHRDIPAKVDTGADFSSIWASDFRINDQNQLEFTLFGPGSPYYTGERLTVTDFRAQRVRNSTGELHVRYCAPLSTTIEGKRIRVNFTLADRHSNQFPVLIGRKTLANKFLVDVSRTAVARPPRISNALTAELRVDPRRFHQKYMEQ